MRKLILHNCKCKFSSKSIQQRSNCVCLCPLENIPKTNPTKINVPEKIRSVSQYILAVHHFHFYLSNRSLLPISSLTPRTFFAISVITILTTRARSARKANRPEQRRRRRLLRRNRWPGARERHSRTGRWVSGSPRARRNRACVRCRVRRRRFRRRLHAIWPRNGSNAEDGESSLC